jgi:hypothetical protein
MKAQFHLFNRYTGDSEGVFDTEDELIEYFRKAKESGDLMGESVYEVFYGRHLGVGQFWDKAFKEKGE